MDFNNILQKVETEHAHEPEFLEAIKEVLISLKPQLDARPDLLQKIPALLIPNFFYAFKVTWEDDKGFLQTNHGYRCHFNNAIGPYKGGLRFSPSVTPSVIKFLAFEQTFKNALTGLPMGGGKGGADFDPKGRSPSEIRRFCVAFAQKLYFTRLAEKDGGVDTPAGDIGVSEAELGFIFGELRRLSYSSPFASLTGKPLCLGGSFFRPEATGYGLVFILERAFSEIGEVLREKRVLITGSGNVALFALECLVRKGAVVTTVSDSGGVLHKDEGFTEADVENLKISKFRCRKRLSELSLPKTVFHASTKVWNIPEVSADVFLPCATQNEADEHGVQALQGKGVRFIAEGANMPLTAEAIELCRRGGLEWFIPSKAANAGGVAVSFLEMRQNGERHRWSREKVESTLKAYMESIFENVHRTSKQLGREKDLVAGANFLGLERVLEAMEKDGSIW